MTIQDLETMLTTISKERMAEVLTMKMPEDRTAALSDNISTLTARVDKIEKQEKEDKVKEDLKNSEESVSKYFEELLK